MALRGRFPALTPQEHRQEKDKQERSGNEQDGPGLLHDLSSPIRQAGAGRRRAIAAKAVPLLSL